jgi:RNA polymerase sigma-70 factor (ECF subfamily)
VLDVAVGTVKSRCARGRARLLPLLSHLRSGDRDSARSHRRRNRAAATAVPETAIPKAKDTVKGGGGQE